MLWLIQLLLFVLNTIFPPILIAEDGDSLSPYYFFEGVLLLIEYLRQAISFCELNVHIHVFIQLAEGLTVGIKTVPTLDG